MEEQNISKYLTDLINEKGCSVDDSIQIDGCIGLTWQMLIEFIESVPEYHEPIRTNLVKIDFNNGDVFGYLTHLANGMIVATGMNEFIS